MRVRSLFLLLAQPELKRRKTITCSFVFFARVKMPRFVLFFFCCRRNRSQSQYNWCWDSLLIHFYACRFANCDLNFETH
jgi:hypothetical protein